MRPTFVISLDEELIWGCFDHTRPEEFSRRHPDPRGLVRDLVALFDELEIPATWAMVGHLFLTECRRGDDGRSHPALARPNYAWYPRDWLGEDPCTSWTAAPLWYGPDLVDLVRGSTTPQELASHSFSHLIYGDPGCSKEAARSDLRACVDAARSLGLELRSFVFPRNVEGHHALLPEFGFTAYRGVAPTWFEALPGRARRAGHLADQAIAWLPPVVEPIETLPGLWNIPGSMLFLHREGVRRLIPFATRVDKARKGLERAVRESKIFHLWFHSLNLSADRAGMFRALREILVAAARLRDAGLIDIRTMGDVAEACGTTSSRAA